MKFKISKEIFNKLENKIKGTEFNSVEDYVIYILNKLATSTNKGEVTKGESICYDPDKKSPKELTKVMKELNKRDVFTRAGGPF